MEATTRRDRRRAATYAEIIDAARAQLAEGKEPALRAVAARIGMTPPALYRYVANHSQLIEVVTSAVDGACAREVAADVEQYPPGDPAARWVAAWAGYRQWALRHQGEFRLVIAHPRSVGEHPLSLRSTSDGYLGQLLHDLWRHGGFELPTPPQLPVGGVPDTDWPASLEWLHARIRTSLHGLIDLEISGYVDDALVSSAALFRASVLDWLPQLGLERHSDRLASVLDMELAG